MNTCTQFTTETFKCNTENEQIGIRRNIKSGISGKTIFHHKVKSGKKPQAKAK